MTDSKISPFCYGRVEMIVPAHHHPEFISGSFIHNRSLHSTAFQSR